MTKVKITTELSTTKVKIITELPMTKTNVNTLAPSMCMCNFEAIFLSKVSLGLPSACLLSDFLINTFGFALLHTVQNCSCFFL